MAKRKSMQMPALLCVPELHEPIACRVVDFSATGAGVVFEPVSWSDRALLFADDLRLVVPRDRAEVDCRIVWRHQRLAGLKFRSMLRHWTQRK
jgi:hypothetical protein